MVDVVVFPCVPAIATVYVSLEIYPKASDLLIISKDLSLKNCKMLLSKAIAGVYIINVCLVSDWYISLRILLALSL